MHARQKAADAHKAKLREQARLADLRLVAKRREMRRDVRAMKQLKRGAMRCCVCVCVCVCACVRACASVSLCGIQSVYVRFSLR